MAERVRGRHLVAALRRAPSTLRRLSFGELLLLAQAPFALPACAYALGRHGLGRVQAFLGRRPARPSDAPAAARLVAARRLSWIVQSAAAYGPWPANCLQRSVVLWWYLQRRGLQGDLRIGVRRDPETRELAFHAWIEYEGVVLNDEATVRQRYVTFDRAIAPRNGSFD